MRDEEFGRLAYAPGIEIAYGRRHGAGPGVVFLGGFNSDMMGQKATHLSGWAAERGRAFLRLDYRGHGASSGRFQDGSIGDWLADALAAFDALTEGKQVVVGSSMGGWFAMLLAKLRPDRVAGLMLLAPAPDFPKRLVEPNLPPDARVALARDGVWLRPSRYSDSAWPFTRHLLEESVAHHVLDGDPIPVSGPVHILHGDRDQDVPWQHGLKSKDALEAEELVFHLLKGGDHRLSDPVALDIQTRILGGMLGKLDQG